MSAFSLTTRARAIIRPWLFTITTTIVLTSFLALLLVFGDVGVPQRLSSIARGGDEHDELPFHPNFAKTFIIRDDANTSDGNGDSTGQEGGIPNAQSLQTLFIIIVILVWLLLVLLAVLVVLACCCKVNCDNPLCCPWYCIVSTSPRRRRRTASTSEAGASITDYTLEALS